MAGRQSARGLARLAGGFSTVHLSALPPTQHPSAGPGQLCLESFRRLLDADYEPVVLAAGHFFNRITRGEVKEDGTAIDCGKGDADVDRNHMLTRVLYHDH